MKKKFSNRSDSIQQLLEANTHSIEILQSKKVVAGFDGFVDSIVKAIKSKKNQRASTFFQTKKEFAKYILDKGDSSFGIELEELETKIGGNMPIMSNALATLGLQVNCIGALGFPQVHPVFGNMSANCKLYSFANPGYSTAFEFNDGKILIAQMNELNSVNWHDVTARIGRDQLKIICNDFDILCMVNWSEIENSSAIWSGLLNDVLPKEKELTKDRMVFFDFADCSRRGKKAIHGAIDLINEYGRYNKVIIGLNQNEAGQIFEALFNKKSFKKFKDVAEKIFSKINVDSLVLHSSREAMVINKQGICCADSFHIKTPKVSTGAGDHFNAGFCTGMLLDLDYELCLILGHAVSGCFVQSGNFHGSEQLIEFFQSKKFSKK